MSLWSTTINKIRAARAKKKWLKEGENTFFPPNYFELFNAFNEEDARYHETLRTKETEEDANYFKGRRDAIRDIMDRKV